MTGEKIHFTAAGMVAMLRAELGVEKLEAETEVRPYRKRQIVAISGSTRFIEEMAVHAWTLEKRGVLALGCHLLPAWYGAAVDHQAEVEDVADTLDELHLYKIDLADELHVVCTEEHLGAATTREIEYARKCNKPVVEISRFVINAESGIGGDHAGDL